MPKISVVINTLNEEANLPRALASVKDFADEVVVVDMKSDDNTQSIAKKAGAKVYETNRMGYVEPARNLALSKATGDWIFILDADEELIPSLAKALEKIVEKDSAEYVRIPRKNFVFGKQLKNSRWWPDYNIRFFKQGKVSWDDEIHSIPITEGRGMDLEAKDENAILHYHYISVSQFVERMNRYTDIQSKSLVEKDYKFSWRDLLTKPAGEFFSRYFFGAGYKDGLHGLALSLLQSLSELVLYLKVWQLQGFKEENPSLKEVIKVIRQNEKDGHYWQADALVKKGGLGSIPARVKRKFKLP